MGLLRQVEALLDEMIAGKCVGVIVEDVGTIVGFRQKVCFAPFLHQLGVSGCGLYRFQSRSSL